MKMNNVGEKLKAEIERLDDERANILKTLCEDDRVFLPEILLNLISLVRAITKNIKSLKFILSNI